MIHFFEDIWSLKIPPKIKYFVWRLFRDLLLSGDNLTKRNIFNNGEIWLCPFYGEEEESLFHTLFWCKPTLEMTCLLQVVRVAKRVSLH